MRVIKFEYLCGGEAFQWTKYLL